MSDMETAFQDMMASVVESKKAEIVEAVLAALPGRGSDKFTISSYEAYEIIHGPRDDGKPHKSGTVSKYMNNLVRQGKLNKISASPQKPRYWHHEVIEFLEAQSVKGRYV